MSKTCKLLSNIHRTLYDDATITSLAQFRQKYRSQVGYAPSKQVEKLWQQHNKSRKPPKAPKAKPSTPSPPPAPLPRAPEIPDIDNNILTNGVNDKSALFNLRNRIQVRWSAASGQLTDKMKSVDELIKARIYYQFQRQSTRDRLNNLLNSPDTLRRINIDSFLGKIQQAITDAKASTGTSVDKYSSESYYNTTKDRVRVGRLAREKSVSGAIDNLNKYESSYRSIANNPNAPPKARQEAQDSLDRLERQISRTQDELDEYNRTWSQAEANHLNSVAEEESHTNVITVGGRIITTDGATNAQVINALHQHIIKDIRPALIQSLQDVSTAYRDHLFNNPTERGTSLEEYIQNAANGIHGARVQAISQEYLDKKTQSDFLTNLANHRTRLREGGYLEDAETSIAMEQGETIRERGTDTARGVSTDYVLNGTSSTYTPTREIITVQPHNSYRQRKGKDLVGFDDEPERIIVRSNIDKWQDRLTGENWYKNLSDADKDTIKTNAIAAAEAKAKAKNSKKKLDADDKQKAVDEKVKELKKKHEEQQESQFFDELKNGTAVLIGDTTGLLVQDLKLKAEVISEAQKEFKNAKKADKTLTYSEWMRRESATNPKVQALDSLETKIGINHENLGHKLNSDYIEHLNSSGEDISRKDWLAREIVNGNKEATYYQQVIDTEDAMFASSYANAGLTSTDNITTGSSTESAASQLQQHHILNSGGSPLDPLYLPGAVRAGKHSYNVDSNGNITSDINGATPMTGHFSIGGSTSDGNMLIRQAVANEVFTIGLSQSTHMNGLQPLTHVLQSGATLPQHTQDALNTQVRQLLTEQITKDSIVNSLQESRDKVEKAKNKEKDPAKIAAHNSTIAQLDKAMADMNDDDFAAVTIKSLIEKEALAFKHNLENGLITVTTGDREEKKSKYSKATGQENTNADTFNKARATGNDKAITQSAQRKYNNIKNSSFPQ